jgi:hypothetical protein
MRLRTWPSSARVMLQQKAISTARRWRALPIRELPEGSAPLEGGIEGRAGSWQTDPSLPSEYALTHYDKKELGYSVR